MTLFDGPDDAAGPPTAGLVLPGGLPLMDELGPADVVVIWLLEAAAVVVALEAPPVVLGTSELNCILEAAAVVVALEAPPVVLVETAELNGVLAVVAVVVGLEAPPAVVLVEIAELTSAVKSESISLGNTTSALPRTLEQKAGMLIPCGCISLFSPVPETGDERPRTYLSADCQHSYLIRDHSFYIGLLRNLQGFDSKDSERDRGNYSCKLEKEVDDELAEGWTESCGRHGRWPNCNH